MNEETKDNVEIDPISDAELEGVAGGVRSQGDSSNGCCTCSGDNCSLTEPSGSLANA